MLEPPPRWAPAAAVLLILACGGEPAPPTGEATAGAPAPPAAPAGRSRIQGVVTYADGDPDRPIRMQADPFCQSLHPEPAYTESVLVDDAGHLANVFVYIKKGVAGPLAPPAEPHLLDQRGCQYAPHVSGLMVGQKLLVRNSDETLHNVHAMPVINREFNEGQPFPGMELERTFRLPEVMIPFKCDVHPWMKSYVAVLDHPFFAVSGGDGSFAIPGLPAGAYLVEAWHESLGTQTREVTLGDEETVEIDFDFRPAV